jgi:hypothetical protein
MRAGADARAVSSYCKNVAIAAAYEPRVVLVLVAGTGLGNNPQTIPLGGESMGAGVFEGPVSSIGKWILGAAASLTMTAGVQAADLPAKAKAVQYVKICSLYGVGY